MGHRIIEKPQPKVSEEESGEAGRSAAKHRGDGATQNACQFFSY